MSLGMKFITNLEIIVGKDNEHLKLLLSSSSLFVFEKKRAFYTVCSTAMSSPTSSHAILRVRHEFAAQMKKQEDATFHERPTSGHDST